MTLVSIFFIVLITAFAVVAFFTEPSKADKLIHSRLASLDRKRLSSGIDEPDIVKEVTFSTIPAFDKFLRNTRAAAGLQLLIEQCDLQWTVGRIMFGTLVLILVDCAGAGGLGTGSNAGRDSIHFPAAKTQAATAALLGAASRSNRPDVARAAGRAGIIGQR